MISSSTSLHQLYISGLNTSSTDIRGDHIVRSGHQEIQTLFAANNVNYPDSISINLVNAPAWSWGRLYSLLSEGGLPNPILVASL